MSVNNQWIYTQYIESKVSTHFQPIHLNITKICSAYICFVFNIMQLIVKCLNFNCESEH